MSAVITIDSPAALTRCVDRLQVNWATQQKLGRSLVVTIEHSEQPMTEKQRRRYWKLLRVIATNAHVEGATYSAEYWDEYYRRELIGIDDDGSGLALGELTVGEVNDVMRHIEAHATGELHVDLGEMQ